MKNRKIKIVVIVLSIIVLNYNRVATSFFDRKKQEISLPFNTTVPLNNLLSNDSSNHEGFRPSEKLFRMFLKKWHVQGASVAIVKNGHLVYTKGFGYADTSKNEEVTPAHLFRIASVSKLLTAVAIMHMEEQNLLTLDQKVFGPNGILSDSIYLGYIDKRVEDISIEHLLNHSAGWYRGYGDHMFMPKVIQEKTKCGYPVQLEDIIQFALSKKLHFAPGTSSSYSNLGFAILGRVISKLSGETYENYLKNEILSPLGIFDMHLGQNLYKNRYENEVRYYEQNDASLSYSIYGTGEKVKKSYGGNDIETLGSAGGWIASPTEIMKLLVAIDGLENSADFLSEESIKKMVTKAPGFSPIGWSYINRNNNWWRTGTLAGSSALLKRQNDSISWFVVTNTSAWKGSKFPKEINKVMGRFLNKIESWPEKNLFIYGPETYFNYVNKN